MPNGRFQVAFTLNSSFTCRTFVQRKEPSHSLKSPATTPMKTSTAAIRLIALFFILLNTGKENWTVARKKRSICALRVKIQDLINKFKPEIEIVVLGNPGKRKRSVHTLWAWLEAKVGIRPRRKRKCSKDVKVRIIVDDGSNLAKESVTITIEWAGVPLRQKFSSAAHNQRDCDMCMRFYILKQLEHVLTAMQTSQKVIENLIASAQ